MTRRLFGTKALLEPVMTKCQSDPRKLQWNLNQSTPFQRTLYFKMIVRVYIYLRIFLMKTTVPCVELNWSFIDLVG